MMKSLIITVAGMSSRFNRDLESPVLKCLYHEDDAETALLYYQVASLYSSVEEIIIVGGFRFNDLEQFCKDQIPDPERKLHLVYCGHPGA